jgi:hypothetical protein
MLTGFAFLGRLSDDHIQEQVQRHGLTELAPIHCGACAVIYRLFARPSKPRDEDDAKSDVSDVKDLTQRAESIIYRDCPSNTPEGQPKRAPHTSRYEFLESGKIAT